VQSVWSQRKAQPHTRIVQQAVLALVAMFGLLGVMAAGYAGMLTPVTLVVDGEARAVHTNQTTVEAVLRDAGIAVFPEDRVQPARDAEVAANATIAIARARPLTVRVDGRTIRVRSHTATLADLFVELDIGINPHDALTIDGHTAVPASGFTSAPATPHTVAVRRAVPLTLVFDDGASQTIETTEPTVGQALSAAGIEVYLADRLTPGASERVTSGATVYVDRSVPVSVQVDGQTIRTRTHRERVGDVLAELGVTLLGQDYAQPSIDALVQTGLAVRVVRVAEEFLIEQEPVAFESQVLPNADMEIDTQVLSQAGEAGVMQKRIRVRYEDGQEVSRVVEDRTLVRAPKPRVTHYGTQIVIRAVQTPDGPREYWRRIRAYATSYSAATAGTPKDAPWYGITATGMRMRKGMIAVDPDVIGLRGELYVPNYGVGCACDTGGGVIGRWVDLGYDDDDLQIWHGWVDVYLLTPAPPADQIRYVLPDWPTFPGR